jgi:aquaporin rerated protein, other eukaryote
VVAMTGKFVDTFLFLLFALGGTPAVNSASPGSVQAPYTADPAKLLYIALCFGLSLAVNASVFFRISGGLFNSAVSEDPVNIESLLLTEGQIVLALCLVGAVGWVRGALVMVSQILGGMAAAAVVDALLPGPLILPFEAFAFSSRCS